METKKIKTYTYAHIYTPMCTSMLVCIIILYIIVTRILKTFSIKMKKDVGTSKPKKHANKVGRLT